MSIGELIITLPQSLLSLSQSIYDVLFYTFKTPVGNVSLFALIFGFGLLAIVTIRIVRMFLP
jgi:hypothetical protein